MSDLELTPSQRTVVRAIPEHLAIERIDRLWIFPARAGKTVETGLFVVSLREEAGEATPEARWELHTFRYRTDLSNKRPAPAIETQEEGRTSRERIERVITGVLARSGDEAGEPHLVELEGDPEAWGALLERTGVQLDVSH